MKIVETTSGRLFAIPKGRRVDNDMSNQIKQNEEEVNISKGRTTYPAVVEVLKI